MALKHSNSEVRKPPNSAIKEAKHSESWILNNTGSNPTLALYLDPKRRAKQDLY